MKQKITFLILFLATVTQAQNSAEIYKQLQRLNTLGRVLYVAAHPDDENTRLISLFSNHYNYRTAYLSMTRGDGGQNLIGTELREGLGVLRTQELLEARKIDGGEQFFTTANDFGYSKHPDETLTFWNKEDILSQIVFRIRAFQPDIIIHRFDHRTPGSTHGHHTSSAMLSEQAFRLANDPEAYPEQLKEVSLWQPKRQFYNTSWWAYGSREKFEQANKSNRIALESNPVDVVMGRSIAEIAAKSRSQHKSQGFGSAPELGSQIEYLELINGASVKNNDPFEGIDTSWNRVIGGAAIGVLIDEAIKQYNIKKPYQIVPQLLKIHALIKTLEDSYWQETKGNEVVESLKNILGLRLQFNSNQAIGVTNSALNVTLKAVNSSPYPIELSAIEGAVSLSVHQPLKENSVWEHENSITLPNEVTPPYWLIEKGSLGNYLVKDTALKGRPETPNPVQVSFVMQIENQFIRFNVPLTYRTTDRVAGEIVAHFQILPEFTTQVNEEVLVFSNLQSKNVKVKVQSHNANSKGEVTLCVPENWKVSPSSIPFAIQQPGAVQEFTFKVTPPAGNHTGTFSSLVTNNHSTFIYQLQEIDYPHISKQYLLTPNATKAVKVDLKSNVKQIAYLKGAGDKVAESLRTIGIEVTEFDVEDLRLENLIAFPTLVIGIRAFNVHEALSYKNEILWDYVKQGGTVIVQYNTSRGLDASITAPYTIRISQDRVTDENAKVTLLQSTHPLLNTPNIITEEDFNGWVQERGLYFANQWDERLTPLLSMHDPGETPKEGSLLVADFGKGKFIFTGLSFFRELPEGVAGAYRLFANLISYGH